MTENRATTDNNTSSQSTKTKNTQNNKDCFFVDPCDIIAVAAALSLLICKNLNMRQIATLASLFNVLSENLTAVVVQNQINQGQNTVIEPRQPL